MDIWQSTRTSASDGVLCSHTGMTSSPTGILWLASGREMFSPCVKSSFLENAHTMALARFTVAISVNQ